MIVLVVVLLAACVRSDPICTVGGKNYKSFEAFDHPDGCNRCFCSNDGLPICTDFTCNIPKTGCKVETEYSTGQFFKKKNSCHTCLCLGNGVTACSLTKC